MRGDHLLKDMKLLNLFLGKKSEPSLPLPGREHGDHAVDANCAEGLAMLRRTPESGIGVAAPWVTGAARASQLAHVRCFYFWRLDDVAAGSLCPHGVRFALCDLLRRGGARAGFQFLALHSFCGHVISCVAVLCQYRLGLPSPAL